MKKVKFNIPLEYVAGHLRYGHKEGTLELTEEEFKEVADQVTESISGKEGYVVLSSDTKTVTATKNNYKAYLLTYKLTYQNIEMVIRQYYFLTKEKVVLYTETRFTEEQFETEEAKAMLDSFTLLNCTPVYGDNNSLISSNEPEDKSSALISSNEPEEKSTALISENEKDEKSSALISENPATNPVVPVAIIAVAIVALLIIKKVTSKKPDKDDSSNL